MSVTLLMKRRPSGATGSPSSLKSGEVAVNEVDGRVYYGKGNDGSGNATSVVELAVSPAVAVPQAIADSGAMSMSMVAGVHAVVDQLAQSGSFTITDLIVGWAGWVLFQTGGTGYTIQFQAGSLPLGENWTGTRQKVLAANSKYLASYVVQPGGGTPYLQWSIVKEGT
jgi:hypothetical protein